MCYELSAYDIQQTVDEKVPQHFVILVGMLFQFLATDAWLMFTIQDYLLGFLCEINEAAAVSSSTFMRSQFRIFFVAGYCRANAIVCRKWYAFLFFDTIINFSSNFYSLSLSFSFIFKQNARDSSFIEYMGTTYFF